VVVANDIKVEAQQELRTLRRQLQEEQDRSAKLSADLEAVQGVRYHVRLGPLLQSFLHPAALVKHQAAVPFALNIRHTYEIPARVLPYLLSGSVAQTMIAQRDSRGSQISYLM